MGAVAPGECAYAIHAPFRFQTGVCGAGCGDQDIQRVRRWPHLFSRARSPRPSFNSQPRRLAVIPLNPGTDARYLIWARLASGDGIRREAKG